VNTSRAALSKAIPTVEIFDQWAEDRSSEMALTSVVIVDTSGSQASVIEQVSEVGWVLQKALSVDDCTSTLITFATEVKSVQSRVQGGQYEVHYPAGSTNVSEALVRSEGILARSSGRRLAIIITDGQFSDKPEAHFESLGKVAEVLVIGFRHDEFRDLPSWIDPKRLDDFESIELEVMNAAVRTATRGEIDAG
jgi:Mg-chelatase subunit ChlD